MSKSSGRSNDPQCVEVEVTIEIPRGSFLKRGSTGQLDFISPLPCPFNYGSVHAYIGGEGDLLDAVVLGPRLSAGTSVKTFAWGAIGLKERYMYDDKLICAAAPIGPTKKKLVLTFFYIYAICKGLINLIKGRRGPSRCIGWSSATSAINRSTPNHGQGPTTKVPF